MQLVKGRGGSASGQRPIRSESAPRCRGTPQSGRWERHGPGREGRLKARSPEMPKASRGAQSGAQLARGRGGSGWRRGHDGDWTRNYQTHVSILGLLISPARRRAAVGKGAASSEKGRPSPKGRVIRVTEAAPTRECRELESLARISTFLLENGNGLSNGILDRRTERLNHADDVEHDLQAASE